MKVRGQPIFGTFAIIWIFFFTDNQSFSLKSPLWVSPTELGWVILLFLLLQCTTTKPYTVFSRNPCVLLYILTSAFSFLLKISPTLVIAMTLLWKKKNIGRPPMQIFSNIMRLLCPFFLKCLLCWPHWLSVWSALVWEQAITPQHRPSLMLDPTQTHTAPRGLDRHRRASVIYKSLISMWHKNIHRLFWVHCNLFLLLLFNW